MKALILFLIQKFLANPKFQEHGFIIPGARGCTPQSCGFRDLYQEFQQLGYQVFGLSSQDSDYQKEFVDRNHIPFEILSDGHFELTNKLNLPTFVYDGTRLIKRMKQTPRHQ